MSVQEIHPGAAAATPPPGTEFDRWKPITESDEHDLYGDALTAAPRPAFDLKVL